VDTARNRETAPGVGGGVQQVVLVSLKREGCVIACADCDTELIFV